ncbi:MAG: type I methionyl aminopeptidase [candidate division FCPU426 bacterium]
MIALRSRAEIAAMRQAGRVVAEVFSGLEALIKPGVTTAELDRWAEALIRERGGKPSFKGYHGFPGTLCTSLNEEVVHGIPGNRKLREGDLLSVDVGVCWEGWHGDAARTYPVGAVAEESLRLLEVTRAALQLGIAQARSGNRLSDIGHAVQRHVEAAGFSVVRDFVGHGIGRELHEDPQVPNFGPPHQGVLLKPGMVLAIEPMVNAGQYGVHVLKNRWTVVTNDGSRSAHFEHTVAISESEAEVLTG